MDSKMFLCVCSRLIQGGKSPEYAEDFNKIYNEVYGTDKILAKLKRSDFPDSPRIQKEYESLLDALENAVVIPELIGKSVYSLYGTGNSKIIKSCGKKIFKTSVTKLATLTTHVPVIICNAADKYKVEVVNYLNQRIEIEDEELSLILEGETQGIAIGKIVRFFVVHVPMTISDVVILLGDDSVIRDYVTDHFGFDKRKTEIDNTIEEMIESAGAVNFGYLEKCDCISSAIESFFMKEIQKCKSTVTAITDDIVRVGSEKSDVFKKLRQTESYRCDHLENQYKEISNTICIFRMLVQDLVDKFGIKVYRYNSSDFESTLFEIFFNYIECSDWNSAKKWAIKISEVDLTAGSLADEYISVCQNKRKRLSVIEFSELTWYLTKFIIVNTDVTTISLEKAEFYSEILEDRISSGKEYFVKALAAPDEEKPYLLVKSMSMGYVEAIQYIIDLYNGSLDADIEKKLLAAVVPEICLKYKGKNSKTFVKMAAAMGNTEAIALLADEYFEKSFSSLKQIQKKKGESDSADRKREIGKNLIFMCDYLINEKYMTKHYKEIKGEVLYCLKDDYVMAMRCLKPISSDASNYCKARMYEYGYGVRVDYEEAKSHYSKISDKEAYKVSEAINRVQEKYEKSIETDEDDYDENKDYSRSYSYSPSYSEGCFVEGTSICMGDGTTKNVEDIEVGDIVLVFDHYNGQFLVETIIANGHIDESETECPVISLIFENEKIINVAILHGFFDFTENKYVCIDQLNVNDYIGHDFAMISEGKMQKTRLLDYREEMKSVKYYAPVSRFHLNVIAEGLLTMVPNEFAMNLFGFDANMKYEMSSMSRAEVIEYDQVKDYVSKEEYESYPICFIKAILYNKNADMNRFAVAIGQFRNNRNLKTALSG